MAGCCEAIIAAREQDESEQEWRLQALNKEFEWFNQAPDLSQ